MFFGPRDPQSALGMYSSTYFIALFICMAATATALIFSRKMRKETVKKVVIGVGIFLWLTEFGKMLFVGLTYGIKEVEFFPLYFCSMFMYASVLTCFKNKTLQTTANAFMFFGGIVGAVTFFCFPTAVIPYYPLFHYMTLRTLVYHSLMIYVGILIVMTGYYQPKLKHFKEYAIFLWITFSLAYIFNRLQGTNLMYISEPLNIGFVKAVYAVIPRAYPFIVALIQLVVPFFLSFGVYRFIIYLQERRKTANKSEEFLLEGETCLVCGEGE